MAKKEKKKNERKRRAPKAVLPEQLVTLVDRLVLESDRGCVLVAAAAIDEKLEEMLVKHFTQASRAEDASDTIEWLLKARPLPPLGSFWIKASLCRVLGIIDEKLFRVIEVIRDLRNDFAHFAEPVEITSADADRLESRLPDECKTPMMSEILTRAAWNGSPIEASEVKAFSPARIRFMGLLGAVQLMLIFSKGNVTNEPATGWRWVEATARLNDMAADALAKANVTNPKD